MLSNLGWLLAGALIALGLYFGREAFWSFRAQSLEDYADAAATTTVADMLEGRFAASGVIYDYTGRVVSRFSADIEGAFDGATGVLDETFVYGGGATDRRQWRIRTDADGRRFTATADDVEGDAKGEIRGDALRMTYRLRLPERAGGHVLDVVDWLYRAPDGAIVNRSEMRKFGFKAAELIAVFRPVKDPA